MWFYQSTSTRDSVPPARAELPCVVFHTDQWDDYTFKTLFHLYLVNKRGEEIELGDVKILQAGAKHTQLPSKFETLGPEYVSLGQTPSYYEKMAKHFPRTNRKVLEALNDVVVSPQLQEKVETGSGFRNSLIRFNDAKICLRDGLAILAGEPRRKGYSFRYSGQIQGADAAVEIDVDLHPKDSVPGRVLAVIGRNGVGKTQFLAQLARDLADTKKRLTRQKEIEVKSAFNPRPPLFTRVIALSFSAFDSFERPRLERFFSYIYCGVRDDRKVLSGEDLNTRHLGYLNRIVEHDREGLWEKHVASVLGVPRRRVSISDTIEELKEGNAPAMSSGQSILAYFIAAALAYLKEGSLVLFDEPEIHLHPNAVAWLMQTLHALLEEFDSYAILATHSPLVIQDVPRNRVIRFEREGDMTTASQLSQESFGENIAELTRQVFETVEIPTFYKQTFQALADTHSFEDVLALFEGELSLHATAYLASLYEADRDA